MFKLAHVLDILFPPRDTQLVVRDLQLAELAEHYAPQRVQCGKFSITTLLHYHTPIVEAVIQEAKFHRNLHAQELLGLLLAAHLREQSFNGLIPELVPVPLSDRRKMERGYNQTEEILKYATKFLPHIRLASELLIRTRNTLPQTTLGRAKRLKNVTGAFSWAPDCSFPLSDTYLYIVVDDVLTTGATLSAAAEALQRAGAKNLMLLALAH